MAPCAASIRGRRSRLRARRARTPPAWTTAASSSATMTAATSARSPRHPPTWRDADRAALRRPGATHRRHRRRRRPSTGARWGRIVRWPWQRLITLGSGADIGWGGDGNDQLSLAPGQDRSTAMPATICSGAASGRREPFNADLDAGLRPRRGGTNGRAVLGGIGSSRRRHHLRRYGDRHHFGPGRVRRLQRQPLHRRHRQRP